MPQSASTHRPPTGRIAPHLDAAAVHEDGCDGSGRPRIAVSGWLSGDRADWLVELCRAVVSRAPNGLALDLTGLAGADAEGRRAVVECLAAGRALTTGVDIAVATSAGRRVLLATLAEV